MESIREHKDLVLDGKQLRAILHVAEHWLELNSKLINAINVYPVPDGDTGTNMLMTLRSAIAATPDTVHIGTLCKNLANAALMEARGNSGVILSQMLRGFAASLESCTELRGKDLQTALASASQTAYAAVPEPIEGTMLTVLREASEGAATASGSAEDIESVLTAAVEAAEMSVKRTPDLLPSLRKAGVVDAGGQGIAVILKGLLYGTRGDPLPDVPPIPTEVVDLEAIEHEGHGYCIEFVVHGEQLEKTAITNMLIDAHADSVLVVGDDAMLHIHAHMDDPGPALSAGVTHGRIEGIKVDNMQSQHERWVAEHQEQIAPTSVGLVAVVQGEGLKAIFRELGATAIVDGGITGKPSTGELLKAARQAGSDLVFLLPNDVNVLMAAEQAAQQAPDLIRVVPTRSIVSGLASAVSFTPSNPPEKLEENLKSASEAVRCIEVTYAVREAKIDQLQITKGDAIAFVDGQLIARADNLDDALLSGIKQATNDSIELISVYLGAEAPAGAKDYIPQLISGTYPGVTVEVVPGGQPHYPYMVGLE